MRGALKPKIIVCLALILGPAFFLAARHRRAPALPADLRDAPRDVAAADQLSAAGAPGRIRKEVRSGFRGLKDYAPENS